MRVLPGRGPYLRGLRSHADTSDFSNLSLHVLCSQDRVKTESAISQHLLVSAVPLSRLRALDIETGVYSDQQLDFWGEKQSATHQLAPLLQSY